MSLPKNLKNVFTLNYSNFKSSYERPIEFSFLNELEIKRIIEKEDCNNNINFLGINFTQNEWKWTIMKKINKNIESMLYDAFLNKLIEILHLNFENIYFFDGDLNKWEALKKNIEAKKLALIYNPKIQLQLKNFELPIELTPGALLYYKNKFSCFLFSYSLRPANIFLAEFTFYYYWLTNFLHLDIQDLVIFWKPFKEEEIVTYSFTLPIVKTLNKKSPCKRISIFKALGLNNPSYENSWFSRFLTREEYFEHHKTTNSLTELEIEKCKKSCDLLSSEIINKMLKMQNIAKILISLLPENYITSEWFKKINWTKLISLDSLKESRDEREKFSFFATDTPTYREALSFLLPNYSLLTSPIIPIQKSLVLSKLFKSNELQKNLNGNSFDYFLSYHFFKKIFEGKKLSSSSIFSQEGKKRLKNQILSMTWKVYYDFESYLEMLTQTSLQVFKEKELIIKKDLIFDPETSSNIFEEKCILELAQPIIESIGLQELEEKNYESLYQKVSKKIVYIAFNKTFETQWLKKLSDRMDIFSKKTSSILALLIKDLTIDLCDWFIFSKNKSLNLIGELQGTHSLKRLSTKVLKNMKQYSSLEHVQEGRGAQFVFLYYFFIFKYQGFSKDLSNESLSPKYWIKDYSDRLKKIWNNIQTYLTEYCSLDVQAMVWAVNWLNENYEKEKLVSQELILNFITWIKSKNNLEMKNLIIDFLKTPYSREFP
ncbi:DUF2779 domain-containing protein [Mycoplasma parvum]|uniref:DUF2779 domain-containing protein n=1 Tax=Mycoplasma parvum str. Indiana TaxID=1403316 RepID=U5NFS8_9MOLU|nr:DUF2779 domain-containing protein [Mycoplasma parvum]AGX89024.1 hypothetical protein PRV_01315 [Mycoplasma parvum str. Indiana]